MLIVLLMLTGVFMIGPSGALVPQIAKDILGGDAFEASLLFAASGRALPASRDHYRRVRRTRYGGGS